VAVRFAFLYLISPLVVAAAAAAPHPAVAPHARCQPIFLSLLVESHLILVCKVPLLSSLANTSHSLYAVIIWRRHLKLLNSCISSPFPLLMLMICFTISFRALDCFFL
jgi:hypothetical protein